MQSSEAQIEPPNARGQDTVHHALGTGGPPQNLQQAACANNADRDPLYFERVALEVYIDRGEIWILSMKPNACSLALKALHRHIVT